MGDKCGRQVGDKWETSINSCGPRHPERETSVGDKGETSANSCDPRNPEWETRGDKCKLMRPQGTQSGRPGEDKCKLTRPKEPRVGDKCGRQV